ncbi:uncharacterized protein LOC123206459 isoform X2 [Mangifera indica]|uniref:uncharacterized protein LOC123206459 isoform X2 n=1 Tax=Mangifera indica TaxID=29780 RepID=UPI001CF9DC6F|nr:uncharacterized protein LOC123206459 isoform X2 [Mangifera indica]
MDKTFYEGVIDSYDCIKKGHKILYADGHVERLNLERQRFKLVGDVDLSKEGQEIDVLKSDSSSHISQREKHETKFQLVKEVKASSLKSNDHAIASKAKARKSAGASANGTKLDKTITHGEPMIDAPGKDCGSKGDDHNSINKLIVKDRKLILTITRPQKTNTTPTKSKSSQGDGGEFPGVCNTVGEDFDKEKEAKNVECSTNIEAKEILDIDQVI